MNIAHVIPHSVTFPLGTHNGRYDWLLQLAAIQVESGHDVTIYSNPRSVIDNIQSIGIERISEDKDTNNLGTFRAALHNNHDIYHSHFDDLHYKVAKETTKQIVYTQHWWPSDLAIEFAQSPSSKNIWAVPPTDYMYGFDRHVGIQSKGRIYHGIHLDSFHTNNVHKSGRLLFVGRVSPEKNLDFAISVAKKANIGLDVIGKVTDKNQAYYDSLKDKIDGTLIRYLGIKDREEIIQYYNSAHALLFPSDITEAFGLVVVEAQACGTPVITMSGGSRAELIDTDKTGFLCQTEDDFIAAIKAVGRLRPEDCTLFAQKFNIHTMADQYSQLYTDLISA